MARYRVKLRGCDDATHMFFYLTDEEAELLRRIAKESQRVSEYNCMPTMHLELAENEGDDDGEAA